MNPRRVFPYFCESYGESFKGLHPSINPCRGCAPIYKGYGKSLKGLDPSMNHRRGPLLFTRATINH